MLRCRKFFRFPFLLAICTLCRSQSNPPQLIDCHVHHNGSVSFLEKLTAKLAAVHGEAILITSPKDLSQVTTFMAQHPGRLIGLGEIDIDAPDV